jgi:hypothetical protein
MNPKNIAAVSVCFVVGAGLGFSQGPPEDMPFQAHGDRGETVHVLPTPAGAAHSAARGGPQPLFSTTTTTPKVYPASYGSGNLVNHGGLEIAGAGYFAVYWNDSVASSTQTSVNQTTKVNYASISDQIADFVNHFGSSSNYTQNNTSDYTIVQQYGSKANISSTLQYRGSFVDGQGALTSISDAAIQTWLGTLLSAHSIPTDSSTLYGLYFPSGTSVTLGNSASCSSFCGYHSVFTHNGMQIKYAVFPYPDCSGCSLSTNGRSVGDMLTIVGSHEIREAVTDPGDGGQNAWYDKVGYEADDKCAWHNIYPMVNGGFWVQPEYSNGGSITASGFQTSYPGPGCIVP